MNNALTGLGLALVLALVVALVGPVFVDWNAYRDAFARRASEVLGAPVTVGGDVEARLLPSPYVLFRDVSAGDGEARVHADEIEITLAIGPLLRGDVSAERTRLVRPRLALALQPDGTLRTPFRGLAATTAEIDRVSLERAEIVDGSVELKAPSGVLRLSAIAGVAEAGSLRGPFRFDGAATTALGATALRLATTRADEAGAFRLKVSASAEGRPETFELDGQLQATARPRFEGRATLVRPVPKGPPAEVDPDTVEPWRLAAKVLAEPARLRFDEIEAAYGSDERGIRLGGSGELALGAAPRFDLALDSRQIDLDRFAPGDGSPAARVEDLLEPILSAGVPPLPGRLLVDLGSLVVGGDVVRGLRAELAADQDGWRIERASAELPGGARFSGRGAVARVGASAGFAGLVDFAATDLPTFRAWAEGGGQPSNTGLKRLSVRGEVAARPGSVTIENATVAADGAASTGRLAWRAGADGGRDRIEARLASERLDLDAFGVDRLAAGVFGGRIAADVNLELTAKALTLFGVNLSGVEANASAGAEGVDIRKLIVRDAGGTGIVGAGRIAQGTAGPEGQISFDLDVRRPEGLLAFARAGGAPEAAVAAAESRAAAWAPAKLSIDLDLEPDQRTVRVQGAVAGGPLRALLTTPAFATDADATFAFDLRAPDARRLAALAGVRLGPSAAAGPGVFTLALTGELAHGMTGTARLEALGAIATAEGAVTLAPIVGLSASGDVSVRTPDAAALTAAFRNAPQAGWPALPAELKGRASVAADQARIEELAGTVGGRKVRGRLAAPFVPGQPITGELAFDELSPQMVAALLFSPQAFAAATAPRRSLWPAAEIGPSPLAGVVGRVALSAERIPLAPERLATGFKATLVASPGGVAFEDVSASFAGGALSGAFAVSRANADATVSVRATLRGARAERLTGLRAASPLSGAVDLSFEGQGTGRSLSGIVATLVGTGSASLRDGAIRRLDGGAVDRIEPQVEAGLPLEAPRIAAAADAALAAADLPLARLSAPFTVSGGVARSGPIDDGGGAIRIGGAAALDLTRLILDADLTLGARRHDAPQLAVSFEGPLAAPVRRVDATALTGWLSVRAVERETRRIEAMEAEIRERSRLARERAAAEERRRAEEKRRAEEARRIEEEERRRREDEERAKAAANPLGDEAPPAGGLPGAFDLTPAPLAPGDPLQITPGRFRGPTAPPQGDLAPR